MYGILEDNAYWKTMLITAVYLVLIRHVVDVTACLLLATCTLEESQRLQYSTYLL